MSDLFTLAARHAEATAELGRRIDATSLGVQDHKANIALLQHAIARHQQAIQKLEAPADEQRAVIADLDAQILAAYDATVPKDHEGPAYFSGTGGSVTVTVKSAGGVQALEIDEPYKSEPSRLPERYHSREITADKQMIRDDLAEGSLEFARLLPRKRSVSVEVKNGND